LFIVVFNVVHTHEIFTVLFLAIFLGIGIGTVYPNLMGGVCDHSDPSWRGSALGEKMFWIWIMWVVGEAVGEAVVAVMTVAMVVTVMTVVAVMTVVTVGDSG
jgi:MFS family permease